MFRNLAGNLITHERIVTTDAKAKELRRVTDRLITKAKRLGPTAHTPQSELDDEQKAKRLHVARQLAAFIPRHGIDTAGERHDLVDKVLVQLSKRFADRPGGYTRIIKLGARKGDGAQMSVIEFVDAAPISPTYAEAGIDDGGAGKDADASEGDASDADTSDADTSKDAASKDAASKDAADAGADDSHTAESDAEEADDEK